MRFKLDSIGRWYQIDSTGRKVLRTRHQRRRVVGMKVEAWKRLSETRKQKKYEEALDARGALGLPREPTKEEQEAWWRADQE